MAETGVTYQKTYYLFGISHKGPTNKPILIHNSSECVELFGYGELTKAYQEAYSVAGNTINIYLVRINGEEASFKGQLIERNFTVKGILYNKRDVLYLRANASGTLWNQASVVFSEDTFALSHPETIGGDWLYTAKLYPTMKLLVDAINNSTPHIHASTSEPYLETSVFLDSYKKHHHETFYFTGGLDETVLDKNQLHDLLEISYNVLEGQVIDFFSVVGVSFDDSGTPALYDNSYYGHNHYKQEKDYLDKPHDTLLDTCATFHGQAIAFAKKQANHGILSHCIMALSAPEATLTLDENEALITKVTLGTHLADRHDINEWVADGIVDNGKYLSIVAGEFEYKALDGLPYYQNAYTAYGAYMTSELTAKSATNQIIPNAYGLRYHLEPETMDYLGKMGVVTFRESILKQAIVVSHGVTAALYNTPFHLIANVRMVQIILSAYNTLLHVFVGQDVERLRQSQAIDKAAESITEALLTDGVAKNIRASVQLIHDIAIVHIEVLCNYSIEYIKASTQAKL